MKVKHSNSKDLKRLLTQAFLVNKSPFPWSKAITAGIVFALPLLIGELLGYLQYGLIACLGSFTYLYVFVMPYTQLAKKLSATLIGITLAVMAGSLVSPYPLWTALLMGVAGAIPVFIFGALKFVGPTAIFFVLCFALATGMPYDPSEVFLRGGLVMLGGLVALGAGLSGMLSNRYKLEQAAVAKVYEKLANFIDTYNANGSNAARKQVAAAFAEAENILQAGYSKRFVSEQFKRLYLLNKQANILFLHMLEQPYKQKQDNLQLLSEVVKEVGSVIKDKQAKLSLPADVEGLGEVAPIILKMKAAAEDSVKHVEVVIVKPSLKKILLGAFDKNSAVFFASLKVGITVVIAAIIAYSAGFERSYWVPLSAAAVMSGITTIGTFHRAIQRTFGTLLGLLVASIILIKVYNGYELALLFFILTFITELCIVRSYWMAAIFFTPSALIMAQYTSHLYDYSYFATVRLTDIVVGSAIGLVAAFIFERRSAAGLVKHYIAKTVRSQAQFILQMFSEDHEKNSGGKMQTNLANLQSVYNTALGEIFSNKTALANIKPVITAVEQLGYYIIAKSKYGEAYRVNDETLAQLLYSLEIIAMYFDSGNNGIRLKKNVPLIEGGATITKAIMELQQEVSAYQQKAVQL